MKRSLVSVGVFALVVAMAAPALAHVTVQPPEAIGESFSAFVVRVPTERDDASTIKVEVQFPPLAFVSFQDVPGWERTVKMQKLDKPIEAFGEELKEAVGTVTWSGGEIEPGEFAEFPFSAAMPAGEAELEFPAIQTYDSGEVVKWTGPEDADEPAARVHTVELGDFQEEGAGQLGALHEIGHEVEELRTEMDQMSASGMDHAAPAAEESSDSTGILLGGIAIVLSLIALIVAASKRRA